MQQLQCSPGENVTNPQTADLSSKKQSFDVLHAPMFEVEKRQESKDLQHPKPHRIYV